MFSKNFSRLQETIRPQTLFGAAWLAEIYGPSWHFSDMRIVRLASLGFLGFTVRPIRDSSRLATSN